MTRLVSRPAPATHDDCTNIGCLQDHGPKRAVVFDPTALLSGRNVTIVKSGRTLISGIDIALRSGEIVTLIGPNGAGKTTLVRALLGLEPLASGTVTRQPGLIVGYVPQRFDIDRTIPLTVARFLNLGLHKSRSETTAALNEVGAARVEIGRAHV